MSLVSRKSPLDELAHKMALRDAEVSVALGELIGVLDDLDGPSFDLHKEALINGVQDIVTFLENPNA